jgi:hypothetical protein
MAHAYMPSFNECFYSNGSLASANDLKTYKDQLTQFEWMLTGTVSYIQIGFAIIGAMVNGVFIFELLQGLRKGILPYQLYYFLLSRAFCDFGSFSIMLVGLMLLVSQLVSSRIITFLLCMTLLPYFTNFGTNFNLALLKLIAVKKPFFYRTKVTKKFCLKLIATSWLLGIADQIIAGDVLLPIFNFGSSFLCHTSAICITIGESFWLVIAVLSYLSVALLFSLTAYFVKKSQKSARKSLWKLGISNGIFLIFNSLEAPGGFVMYSIYPLLTKIYATIEGKCKIIDSEEFSASEGKLIFVMIWYCFMVVRMILDPIANILIDKKLRKLLKEDFHFLSYCRNNSVLSPISMTFVTNSK